jgi:PAS domain S-box-containing protein
MNRIKLSLQFLCTPEFERATVVLTVFCVLAVMALFMYLARREGNKHLKFWAAALLFYAIYLTTAIGVHFPTAGVLDSILMTSMLGVSAIFMFWGDSELAERARTAVELKLSLAIVATWSALGGFLIGDRFVLMLPVCVLVGSARCLAGYLYLRNQERNRGKKLLFGAFVLWGFHSFAFSFLHAWPWMLSVMYILSSILALGIAIGLIVDEESKASEQKYRVVLNSMQDAVFMIDLWTLKIMDANAAALRLTKRPNNELLSRTFLEVCPDLRKGGTNVLENRQLLAAVLKPYSEFRILRSDGVHVICEGDTNLVHWHGASALQVNVREVAEKEKTGQIVRRAEKLSSLGQLVAGVAHELNNPLAVVVACSQMMARQKQGNDKDRGNVLRILHETERASKIVRDLLSFARPCEPQLKTTDLNGIIRNVVDVRQDEFKLRNIQMVTELSPTLPLTKADPMQIEQVLTNLIANAIHALSTQKGERVLTLRTEEVGSFLRITVADNGPGIRREILGRIFDPFFTTKPPGQGTGLGLSICSSIAVEHRGKIWVESELGKGAKFLLELPLVPCEEEKGGIPASPITADRAETTAADQRVLVVDDEPGLREVLSDILKTCGYAVDAAGNGVEALDLLSAGEYDLIISDLCMPKMDGEKLYRCVREKNLGLATRMIFVTGDTVSPKSRTFLESIGNRWITKPFNISTIEDIVGRALREAAREKLLDLPKPDRRYVTLSEEKSNGKVRA